MEKPDFEAILSSACEVLTGEFAEGIVYSKSSAFEDRVRDLLAEKLQGTSFEVDFDPHPHVFPDICLPPFGVEVKFTSKDTWRSVANSIFESTRNQAVTEIYVVFGKQGGDPEVRWGNYGECVTHVRTSHVPRFEVELYPDRSLFEKIGIAYPEFSQLPVEDRMKHIRNYARGRLKEGERLWWIDEPDESRYTLPLQVRLYTTLEQSEKRQLRAEAALLCPQIVKSSRAKGKYGDAVLYILTTHGVLCSQARDLFSAGSVALRADSARGGNYIERALRDIEDEMLAAAASLDDELIVEYWGNSVEPEKRILEWLTRVDQLATSWVPSKTLFQNVSH